MFELPNILKELARDHNLILTSDHNLILSSEVNAITLKIIQMRKKHTNFRIVSGPFIV